MPTTHLLSSQFVHLNRQSLPTFPRGLEKKIYIFLLEKYNQHTEIKNHTSFLSMYEKRAAPKSKSTTTCLEINATLIEKPRSFLT